MMLAFAVPLAFLSLAPLQTRPDAGPPDAPAEQVRDALARTEAHFDHLRIRATHRSEARNASDTAWEYAGEVHSTAWFADKPGGKARLDVTRQVIRWMDGTAPFCESSYRVTYDGRTGMMYRSSTGPLGKAFPIQRGALLSQRPNTIADWGSRFTGWGFSALGFSDRDGRRLSEILAAGRKAMVAERLTDAGAPRIRLTLEQGTTVRLRYRWTFAPEQGCALVAFEHYQDDALIQTIRVSELIDAGAGVFFPRSAERVIWSRQDRKPRERELFTAEEAVANDGTLPDDHFRITFPNGTVLEDQASDVVLRVGQSPAELRSALGQQVALLRAAMQQCEPPAPAAALPGEALSWWRMAAAATGLVLLAGLVLRALTTRRRPQALTAASCVVLLVSGARAQERSVAVAELGPQRIYNCGVNTATLVLEAFGRTSDLEEIARSLDCGRNWESPASLAALQNLFKSRGLTVAGFKSLQLPELRAQLDGRHVALVHCQASVQDEGHFIVLAAARRDELFQVNAGADARWIQQRDFEQGFGRRMTGFALVVSDDTRPAVQTCTLDEEVLTIDLGDVSEIDGTVAADLPVRNPGAAAMEIIEAQSSCSCFQKAEFVQGRGRLEPGQSDTLRLTFARSKLAVGPNLQQVYVGFKSPQPRKVLFKVMALVKKDAVARRLRCHPERLDLGVVRDRAVLDRPQTLAVILPAGVSVQSFRSTSPAVRIVRTGVTADYGNLQRAPTRIENFEITLAAPAEGDLAAEALFEVSDEKLRGVSVPILAQFRKP